jgi:tetratricopeptide (TPR) repeat protein
MDQSLKSDQSIREYLLGRVSDETSLSGIEELLFTDEAFCSQVALVEDGLINDYVCGFLNDADAADFRAMAAGNPERSFKLQLTQALREKALAVKPERAPQQSSLLDALKAFFRQPMYVGALAVLLVAVLISAFYLNRRNDRDELAELRSLYQQSRPTETRISEFGYAPLSQLRGAPDPADKNRLHRIDNNLNEAVEKTPNAQTHHALGVFYLTQQKHQEAIAELVAAAKLADQDAKIHNDLGCAYYELAKTKPKDQQFEAMAQALEEFSKALALDGNFLEALFNKSMVLQELGNAREAKESWNLYLSKDASSPWAAEARKNLARLASAQNLEKLNDRVLADFLTAHRNHDEALAQRIHDETKGLLREPAIALQLSRRYLLARQNGAAAAASESLAALTDIGKSEQTRHAEFFFLS